MPIQAPQWSEYLSCTVCCNDFDSKSRRPVSLACGHTMCKTCLRGLSCKQCPFDQTTIGCDIDNLPENLALLQLTPNYDSNAAQYANDRSVNYSLLGIRDVDIKSYNGSLKCVEDLAPFLKPSVAG